MRIRQTTVRIATCCLLALACATISPAQQPLPKNDGWVTDLGDFLTPTQESTLEALMESYKVGSGHEIALLTVPDLGGRSLENYALEVARAWGLGEKGR
ncbi:MAG: TPM domain-containing protein, partial [Acidobacteriota bacterium]